ncbi:DEAD/DEAH box helicase [Leptospira noguchii]|uniref:DEAD/DEAH box helicase n=1 Tax=Leptospira noguchii TaxID=28182 RepID=UPI0003285476|nr:DEAD/DEAH box helicase [Leptospira noguchii]EMS86349.1 DEAD/DEAH box helicase [Leptospira noguchii str. Cascata]
MIIDKLTEDIFQDKYFSDLFKKASQMLAHNLFYDDNIERSMSQKELTDILRYADILSNSNNPQARNKSYQIIATLNEYYRNDPKYRTIAHAVFAKLGNFPGINYLSVSDQNTSELPFDRDIEKAIKEKVQEIPNSDGLIFTDVQFDLFTKISDSDYFSFSGPTSMGKSFIIKSMIRRIISSDKKNNIIVMVPTRALIAQFSNDLRKEFSSVLEEYGYKIMTTSFVSDIITDENTAYLFILTPERLLSFLSNKKSPKVAYLFVDEAHKLASIADMRSITSYTAVEKTIKANREVKLFFSAPNVSNPEIFLKLFNKEKSNTFHTVESPVSQNLFFVDLIKSEVTHYAGLEKYIFVPKFLDSIKKGAEFIRRIGYGESNIIYCSAKTKTITKAIELYEIIEQDDNKEDLYKSNEKISKQIKNYIHEEYYLAKLLKKGVAYHFGNLPQLIRNKIEFLFKEGKISYLFCTSTLLEGVNMPSKNIFILNNKKGSDKLEKIDFWNLAGRAGRLKYELSGNIFCLRETESEWKTTNLLDDSEKIQLEPTIERHINKNLKEIEGIIKDQDGQIGIKALTEILKYIANVISIDTLEITSDYKSNIIRKLIEENKDEIIELSKNKYKNIEVPINILNVNQSIKVAIQDKAYKNLKSSSNKEDIKLPARVDYELAKLWLNKLYELFEWETEEKILFKKTKDSAKKRNLLSYYALLMVKWINGEPLSLIISHSLQYYRENAIQVYDESGRKEVFDNSPKHINIVIGNIIDDIEKVLRFSLEKYFNDYYSILVEVLGEEEAGPNWAIFLEYGTQNPIIIELQIAGLSRHSANYLYKNHSNCLTIEKGKVTSVNKEKLKSSLDNESIEYEEISSLFF